MSLKDLAQLKDCFITKKIFSVVVGWGRGLGGPHTSQQSYRSTFHIPRLLLAQQNIRNNKEREKLLLT